MKRTSLKQRRKIDLEGLLLLRAFQGAWLNLQCNRQTLERVLVNKVLKFPNYSKSYRL